MIKAVGADEADSSLSNHEQSNEEEEATSTSRSANQATKEDTSFQAAFRSFHKQQPDSSPTSQNKSRIGAER